MMIFYIVVCISLATILASALSGLFTVTVEHFFGTNSDGIFPIFAAAFGLCIGGLACAVLNDMHVPFWSMILLAPIITVTVIYLIVGVIGGVFWLIFKGVGSVVGHFRRLGEWLREHAQDYRFHRNIDGE